MSDLELLKKALATAPYAYAPFSGFKVGAALLSKKGKIHTGVNIENASFGATLCAERSALASAVSQGEREFEKIAVITSTGSFVRPCGICRQVLAEFAEDILIVSASKEGSGVDAVRLPVLLPEGFAFKKN